MKTAAFLLAVAAGVVLAAEGLGAREGVYLGALAGAAIGAVGWVAALRIVARQKASPAEKAGRWDIWALWAAGMLARAALLGAFAVWFWSRREDAFVSAMLTLASVYLALLCWETGWLYRALGTAGETERKLP